MSKRTFGIVLRILIVIAVTVLSAVALFYFFKLFYPFIIAALLVMLINPIIQFLQRKLRFPRLLAVITTIILFISVFIGAVTILIAEIIAGTTYLADIVPDKVDSMITSVQIYFTQTIVPFYENIASKFNALDQTNQLTIINSIQEAGNKLSGSATSFLQGFLTFLPSLVSWIPSAATAIVFILLATFFISKDWEKLSKKVTELIPELIITPSKYVLNDLKHASVGFFRAQLILISVTFVINLIALLIMQVNHALTIALIMGLLDLIPYLGISVVLVPWAIYEFFTGNTSFGIGLSVLFVVVSGTRQFIEPKILSSSLNLDPLATLISLFVGFQLFGFLGLIVGPIGLVIGITLKRTGVFHNIYQYILQREEGVEEK